MSDRVPLVLDGTGQMQQLQSVDDLNIPLRARVDQLEVNLNVLMEFLVAQGIELPDELTQYL